MRMNGILGGMMVIGALLCAPAALAHNTDGRVSLEPLQEGAVQAGHLTIQFQLVDNQTNKLISDQDLLVESEKKIHFYIYDPALVIFVHVHPTYDGTQWTVDADLPVNGDYWIWAQGQLTADQKEFVAGNRLYVRGGQPANPVADALGDHRSGADGISEVTLSPEPIHAGRLTMVMVDFSRTDGTQPVLTPYLGNMAHFTIVSGDADSLIHTHPMAGSSPTNMMIHAQFPEPGDYRIWVQFVDGGTLRTVPLSVTVVQ